MFSPAPLYTLCVALLNDPVIDGDGPANDQSWYQPEEPVTVPLKVAADALDAGKSAIASTIVTKAAKRAKLLMSLAPLPLRTLRVVCRVNLAALAPAVTGSNVPKTSKVPTTNRGDLD